MRTLLTPTQERAKRPTKAKADLVVEDAPKETVREHAEKVMSVTDDILDEIDNILNSEDVVDVSLYVQKGGE